MPMIDAEAAEVTKQKQAALRLVLDAFAEADLDGIDSDCMAQAALFAALKEFVMVYGEEPVATFTERLPERVRNGEFTVQRHG
jgi:predicted YcjX-like family ATPase